MLIKVINIIIFKIINIMVNINVNSSIRYIGSVLYLKEASSDDFYTYPISILIFLK